MKRIECLRLLAPLVTDELVLTSLTGANWEWRYLTDHEGSMNVSSMGSGTAVGAGMALGLPRRRVSASTPAYQSVRRARTELSIAR